MTEEKKSYKSTVFLPKTDFPMRGSLPQREPVWLEEWEKEKLYETQRNQMKGKPKYVLHDGPPYANGHIHIGHALNKVLKDIIVKYKTMQGFDALYIPGWDCHGLPIEHQLFKELGKRKEEVDPLEFRKEARKYARKFVDIQKEEFKRFGIWGEWEQPYLTMNYSYQKTIADSFLKLYEQGYIYRSLKPVPWCFECETALADAELEYKDKQSKAIFVPFELDSSSDENKKVFEVAKQRDAVSVVIWTTTPWTLPANVAMAFHPQLDYALLKVNEKVYIVAEALISSMCEKFAWSNVENMGTMKGKDFVGIIAKSPLSTDKQSVGVHADYVSSEDGSGIVHIAPGHGEDDFQVGREFDLKVLSPVDSHGKFTEECEAYKGIHVFKANKLIIEFLEESKILLFQEDYQHSYPHCWRCKKPILFRATNQWFLKVDHNDLRNKALAEIREKIQFKPDWGKNRIGAMMETRPDWCLSRQRLWGVPIPLVINKNTGEVVYSKNFSQKVSEVFSKEGADGWFQRPIEDFLEGDIENREELVKELDIIDVWFDSGVSHQSVLKNNEQLSFPADLYLEGSDQHRGWFQTSLIASMALEGHPPFKSVLTHGFVVDGDGKKMSKSAGNVISPQEILKQYGADVLRLWVSSVDYSVDVRMSKEIVSRMVEAYRRIRNTFRYLLGNLADFDPTKNSIAQDKMTSMDRFAVAKAENLLKEVTKCYEQFRFHEIYRLVHNFATVFLSNFYCDVLKDRIYTFNADDVRRRSAQTALHHIYSILVKILAPIIPFTTNEAWKAFGGDNENSYVHLAEWPVEAASVINEKECEDWENLLTVRNQINARLEESRSEGVIGSPLESAVYLQTSDAALKELLEKYKEELKTIFIVSEVEVEFGGSASEGSSNVVFESDKSSHPLVIKVKRVSGEKCERCWNYSSQVGSFEDHLTICERCIDVVREVFEKI